MRDPLVIWGAGAIGGTLAAFWARSGEEVLLVDVSSDHIESCRTSGINIEGPVQEFRANVQALLPGDVTGRYSRIVLAVKAHHTEAASLALTPHLTEDGFVLSAQNGLNELVISKIVGVERTVGAFVNFGADWLGPGRILFGNRGAVVIGELDGSKKDRTYEIHRLMQAFEPQAVLTTNIWGYLWSKLAYGAMLFATALTNDSMADNFANPTRASLWIGLGREVIGLAHARGISPVGFNGFDPTVFAREASEQEARSCIEGLAKFNRHSAKTHSGIWRDIVVRKRKTEIDEQIGILAKLAKEVGMEVPLISCLVELIHDVEEGRRVVSQETLGVLLDQSCSL